MRRLVSSRLIWIYTVCKDICFSLQGWKVNRDFGKTDIYENV